MKLSDYVMDFLERAGVEHVFTVSGGGIMHLLDSLGAHPRLKYTCNHHEQACAIAAEGYARIRGGPGVCLVTTGPGSTNALSGVAGAWVDSIPIVVISGQVRRDLMADFSTMRQLGPQEINIDPMGRAVTKYFTTVSEPAQIRYELEKALAIAISGRPGPVWVNLPLDVQGALIDEGSLEAFRDEGAAELVAPPVNLDGAARKVLEAMNASRRPVLVPGNGIRLANAHDLFTDLVDRLQVPVLPTIGSTDVIEETHPMFAGRFGPLGQRCANFAIQNADFVLAIGASLSLASVGFNTESFAPGARKVMVNVDPHEIGKALPRPDVRIVADARQFMEAMLRLDPPDWGDGLQPWRKACRTWRMKYPALTPEQAASTGYVNSYVFADALSDALVEGDAVLTGNSLDWWSVYQSYKVKRHQRVFTNVNFGSMGWDLPAALGACIARNGRRTVLVTGDGSLQFNIQELQTIVHHRLPLKIFVLSNGGYASIRSMQQTHFGGRLAGADANSGVSTPALRAIADAYGLRFGRLESQADLTTTIRRALETDDSTLYEVSVDPAQERSPRVMSRRRPDGLMESGTLQNMYPFLPADEVESNMQASRPVDRI